MMRHGRTEELRPVKLGVNHENACSRSYYGRMPYGDYDQIELDLSFLYWHLFQVGNERLVDRRSSTRSPKGRGNRGTADTNSRNHGYASQGCVTVASANAESRAGSYSSYLFPTRVFLGGLKRTCSEEANAITNTRM
jgi:hypothetical protein